MVEHFTFLDDFNNTWIYIYILYMFVFKKGGQNQWRSTKNLYKDREYFMYCTTVVNTGSSNSHNKTYVSFHLFYFLKRTDG